MKDILLAKTALPADVIDASIGEPHLVREILIKTFDIHPYELPKVTGMYEYPSPIGYDKLIQLLEEKYKAPVIITNGAKQGLAASFYALKQMGFHSYGMRTPYWALIPPLATMHGLEHAQEDWESYLLLAPNNPDGHVSSAKELKAFAETLKDLNVPLIHDAAYYTHSYMPETHSLPAIGDLQIYSISKMLGLSGLRVGFVVCHNREMFNHILHYMEAMTVGVSNISQIFLFDLMKRMNAYPTLNQKFEGLASMALEESKKIIQNISPEVLEITDIPNGMFGWFKVGPKADFAKAKVKVIDGALFGAPGMIRMNLAISHGQLKEAVERLNNV